MGEDIAVVTGAGSGIGRATAVRIAARGFGVICTGRTAASLEETIAVIQQAGGRAEAVVADCSTMDGVQSILDAARGRPIHTLVHAAGADTALDFSSTGVSDFDRMFHTNVRGPFFLTQGLVPFMVTGSSVVFVGSVSARRGRIRHAAYGASKAALCGLAVNLAAELGPRIRVNVVSPGATRTKMLRAFVRESTQGLPPSRLDELKVSDAARNLLGRVAEADEVAATVVHVALDATSMTGQEVLADMGYAAS